VGGGRGQGTSFGPLKEFGDFCKSSGVVGTNASAVWAPPPAANGRSDPQATFDLIRKQFLVDHITSSVADIQGRVNRALADRAREEQEEEQFQADNFCRDCNGVRPGSELLLDKLCPFDECECAECEHCGEQFRDGIGTDPTGAPICQDCERDVVGECAACNRAVMVEELTESGMQGEICAECRMTPKLEAAPDAKAAVKSPRAAAKSAKKTSGKSQGDSKKTVPAKVKKAGEK
jgi:hypothetical protein